VNTAVVVDCLYRAGLEPMQPMQLHWAPRHGVLVDYSFLPDTPYA